MFDAVTTKCNFEILSLRSLIISRLPAVLATILLLLIISSDAFGRDLENRETVRSSDKMKVEGEAYAPIGFVGFCYTNPQECSVDTASNGKHDEVRLTDERFGQLVRVQRNINDAIRPRSDQENYGLREHWTYPANGYGDCEDYALAKRKALLQLGWPKSSLIFAVALTERGEHHLVLIAVTEQGDYVLDSRYRPVWLWSKLRYKWLARQSTQNTKKWLKIKAS
ncbi:MAG: transglutaminase-like cysteine peptidase [Rhodospirillales bacterium]|jgi:predicted transglutaminase-like cysteine proteinase|nr:transglutaminase-like cysteine peptidase [Rhodospirillales bacterium]MDP6645862.1 transglutaminase-like cysteine peptidase [Rhodospirillales bacterium]|tara:strand:+ start:2668 stop:3339 length:672 start_codon:yes stop_codon:yes gene_type:complete